MNLLSKVITLKRLSMFRCLQFAFLLVLDDVKENDVVKAAIILSHDTSTEVIVQVLENLQTCIKYGNCEVPIKNFK